MTSPIVAMVDRACGFVREPPEPRHACMCGVLLTRNEKCSTPERCAILHAREGCCCSIAGATRKECGDARSLKTGCRCHCHARLPEEREEERRCFWVVKWNADYLCTGYPTWRSVQKDARRMSRAMAIRQTRGWPSHRVVRVRKAGVL